MIFPSGLHRRWRSPAHARG